MKRDSDISHGGGRIAAPARIMTGWRPEHSELWGRHPVCINHSLPETGLFTDEALAGLIENYPREHHDFLHMGEQGVHKKLWSEGEIGGASGKTVLEAIRQGRLWLNLRRVHEVDSRYGDLLAQMFEELESLVPNFSTYKHNFGILISSPKAQVYYHADIPGQSLWQIRGEKRVYVYPNYAPFLPEPDMERVILGEIEEDIPYEPWFDDYAQVFTLKPGEMLNWQLNAPHRVENLDCVNVSVTTEHWTDDIRNMYAIRYANGLLRSRFGVSPPLPFTHGPAFWAKAALAAGVKKSGLLKRFRYDREVTWTLDPKASSKMAPLAETYHR